MKKILTLLTILLFAWNVNAQQQTAIYKWNAAITYNIGDLVTVSGDIYKATTSNSNDTPPSGNWIIFPTIDGNNAFTGELRSTGNDALPWEASLIVNAGYVYDNYRPFTETGVAGEILSVGNIVYQGVLDKWWKADADVLAQVSGRLALVTIAAAADAATGVTDFIAQISAGTLGADLYLSNTPGAVTETLPTTGYARIIGTQTTATRKYIILGNINYVAVDGTNVNGVALASGTGDVVGPASSTDDNLATFDLATGKLIQDSGINISAVTANTAKVTNANHSGDVTGDAALTIANAAVDIAHLSATGTPSSSNFLRGDNTWATPAGSGNVSTSGAPVANDFARFVGSTDIEGRSYAETRGDLGLVIGTNVQAYSLDLDNVSGTNSGDNAVNSLYSGLVSNVTTNLSEGTATTTTVDVNSSDGTNATLVSASTSRAGLLTKAKWDEIVANTAKAAGTPTALSTGTVTATTYGITSDGGTDDVVLPEANTTQAGLLGADKWDEIVANTLKGNGNVSSTGTPVNNELAVWTDGTTIEGESELTYVGGSLSIESGANGAQINLDPTNGQSTITSLTTGDFDLEFNLLGTADYTFKAGGADRLVISDLGQITAGGDIEGGSITVTGGTNDDLLLANGTTTSYSAIATVSAISQVDLTQDAWDSDWTLGTGTTNGSNNISFSTTIASSSISVAGIEPSASGYYLVSAHVSAFTAGAMSVRVGIGEASTTYVDAAGWHSILVKSGSATTVATLGFPSAATFTMDHFSVIPTDSPFKPGPSFHTTATTINPGKPQFHTGETYYTTSASAITLNLASTINANEDNEIVVVQMGTGAVTIDGGAGTTVNGVSAGNIVLSAQYTKATIRVLDASTSYLVTEEKIGGGTGMSDLIDDTSPTLGGHLDAQSYSIELGIANGSIGTARFGQTIANTSYIWFNSDEIVMRSHDNSTGTNYGQVETVYDDFAGLRMTFSDVGNGADGTLNYFGLGDLFKFEDVDAVSFEGAVPTTFSLDLSDETVSTTITTSDVGGLNMFSSSATAVTFTIPDTLTEAAGASFTVIVDGAGACTITTTGTATINGSTTFDVVIAGAVGNKVNGVIFIQKVASSDDWFAVGAY